MVSYSINWRAVVSMAVLILLYKIGMYAYRKVPLSNAIKIPILVIGTLILVNIVKVGA